MLTLDEILTLVGRLDDTPGFDTPRERFRRFLTDRLTKVSAVRELIEQDHHSASEQHHRALQDVAVWLGHFLGFEPIFGTYHRISSAVKYDGHWRSRRAHIVLEVRSDQAPRTDLDNLSRSLAALAATEQLEPDSRAFGLVVLMPPYVARGRLDDLLSARNLRVATVHALLWMADRVATEHLTHDEVVRLLSTGFGLDFVVELVDRFASFTWPVPATGVPSALTESTGKSASTSAASPTQPPGPSFWLATIGSDENGQPEQFVESVIGKRHIFAVPDEGAVNDLPCPEDWISFFIPEVGVVGHAQVEEASNASPELIRDATRFRHLFHVKNAQIYVADPVALEPPSVMSEDDERDSPFHGLLGAQRMRAIANESSDRRRLVRISRQEFETAIGYRPTEDAGPEDVDATGETRNLDTERGG